MIELSYDEVRTLLKAACKATNVKINTPDLLCSRNEFSCTEKVVDGCAAVISSLGYTNRVIVGYLYHEWAGDPKRFSYFAKEFNVDIETVRRDLNCIFKMLTSYFALPYLAYGLEEGARICELREEQCMRTCTRILTVLKASNFPYLSSMAGHRYVYNSGNTPIQAFDFDTNFKGLTAKLLANHKLWLSDLSYRSTWEPWKGTKGVTQREKSYIDAVLFILGLNPNYVGCRSGLLKGTDHRCRNFMGYHSTRID